MSLSTLARINEALEQRPAEIAQERERGATIVGYFCCNVPEELLLAADLVPLRLGKGGSDRLVELGGRWISHQNCVFVRQNVGLFAENDDPYVRAADVVLAAATCPQIYRLAEVVEHFFGREVEIIGVPRNFTSDEGREYFRAEFADLARKLEQRSGRKITPERLEWAIGVVASIRDSIQELYDIQASRPDVLSWRETLEVVHAGFYLDRVEYTALLRDLIAEARELSEQVPASADARPRIFLSGTVIPPGDTKLIDIIEEQGGRIVGDDLCSGLRPARGIRVQEATVESLADAYLDRVPCAALPHLSLEDDRRLANIRDSIARFAADAVVLHSLRYCDPITFKASETKRALKGVSFIEIHTEYASSDLEGIRTRIGAFVEMLASNGARRTA